MLEKWSFDHMLGFLYTQVGDVSPTWVPFGKISNMSCVAGVFARGERAA